MDITIDYLPFFIWGLLLAYQVRLVGLCSGQAKCLKYQLEVGKIGFVFALRWHF